MKYDHSIWNKYTDENENQIQSDVSKFFYHISLALGATKICEAGCNVGNNLVSFPEDYDVTGIDMNPYALEKARTKFPNFKFKQESIDKISVPDSYFELVFTRGVLIHIPNNELDNVLQELFRISKKWILNLEYFGDDGKMIDWKRGDDLLWYRDMGSRWKKFNVEIISDIELPLKMDPGKMRCTLIKKK